MIGVIGTIISSVSAVGISAFGTWNVDWRTRIFFRLRRYAGMDNTYTLAVGWGRMEASFGGRKPLKVMCTGAWAGMWLITVAVKTNFWGSQRDVSTPGGSEVVCTSTNLFSWSGQG